MAKNLTGTYENGHNDPNTLINEMLAKNVEILKRLVSDISSQYELPSDVKDRLVSSMSEQIDSSVIQDLADDVGSFKKLIRSFIYVFESCKLKQILSTQFYSLIVAAKYTRNSHNQRIRTYISARYMDKSGDATEQLLHIIEFDTNKKPSSGNLRAEFNSFIEKEQLPVRNLISVMSDNMCLIKDDADMLFVDCLKETGPHVFNMPIVKIFSNMFDLGDNFRLIDQSFRELIACGENYFKRNRGRFEQYIEYVRRSSENLNVRTDFLMSERSFLTYGEIDFEWKTMRKFFYSEYLKLTSTDDSLISDNDILDDIPTISHPNDYNKTINKTEENISIIKRLCELINEKTNRACAYFLRHCLSYYGRVNKLFKNRKIGLPNILRLVEETVKALAGNFIKEENMPLIFNQRLDCSKCLKPANEIYFGPDCAETLKDVSPDDLARFHESCTKFYLIILEKLRKILIEYYKEFGPLSFIDPEVALCALDRRNVPDLLKWRLTYFPYVPVYGLATEWRELPNFFGEEQKLELMKLGEKRFWKTIGETVNPVTYDRKFPCLKKLVDALYSLPFSFRDLYQTIDLIEEWRENDDSYSELLERAVLLSVHKADPTGFCSETMKKYQL